MEFLLSENYLGDQTSLFIGVLFINFKFSKLNAEIVVSYYSKVWKLRILSLLGEWFLKF